MTERISDDQSILISVLPASYAQRRVALIVIILLLFGFVGLLPFSRLPLIRFPQFVPIQQIALLISEIITAALLFGQYTIHRSRGLNILEAGYLFTGLILIPHALAFPGAFTETGLLNAGPQTSAWLYLAWHAGLPLAIIVYVVVGERGRGGNNQALDIVIAVSMAVSLVLALAIIVISGHDRFPALMAGDRFTFEARVGVGTVLVLPLAALVALSARRPLSVLDLWLMVVMFAWFGEVFAGSFMSSGRFDIGWYVGRAYAVISSTTVLIILLSETIALYARSARAAINERRERERRMKEMEAVLIHLSRVNELGQNVSSLIHEITQPLTAISNYLAGCIQLASTSNMGTLKPLLERCQEQTVRASGIIRRLRDFIANRDFERTLNDVPEMLSNAIRLATVGVDAEASTIQVHCEAAASTAYFDLIQIEQVVFNLVRNAIEAMGNTARGVLTIRTTVNADDMIEVSVADTGPGLAPEIRSRLFEPFVTSKPGGLGIGLSICRAIIEAHGGRFSAEDNPGGGTVFRFTLPRQAATV